VVAEFGDYVSRTPIRPCRVEAVVAEFADCVSRTPMRLRRRCEAVGN
jgi:hypothetical protein